MIRRKNILLLTLFLVMTSNSRSIAQDTIMLAKPLIVLTQQDSIIPPQNTFSLDTTEINNLPDLRTWLKKQNTSYTVPYRPNDQLMRFLQKDNLTISENAYRIIHQVYKASDQIPDYMTYKDTVIADILFLPLVIKADRLPKAMTFYELPWSPQKDAYSDLFPIDTTFFASENFQLQKRKELQQFLEINYPDYFRYTAWELPTDIPEAEVIKPNIITNLFNVEKNTDFAPADKPKKYLPKIKYWRPYFESTIMFTQNYISPNWHKGGNGNINLYTRNYFKYNYNKDKIQLTNELEWKASFYNAPKDTLHDYRIGDDVFRIHSNLGYKAFSKWFYTFDAEFKTQIFTNYAENSKTKLASFLSPMSINLGLGMKYELSKKFEQKYKSLSFSTNLAPLSVNYMYSKNRHIDLNRHGFKDGRNYLTNLGSTVRADLNFQINRTTNWTSRFYYFTSYDRIIGEFENALNLAISRFFSTQINLNLRFDDGVNKKDEFDTYLQVFEKISFGFNYKW